MAAFFRFIAGVFIGTVYVLGIAAIGYILFEYFGFLYYIILASIVVLLVLNITSFTSFPRAITNGLLVPQLATLMAVGFLYAKDELTLYFTDDLTYRSCVGNFDHKQGISDCTVLLGKLETKGHIVLKEIKNTKGNYWLAEILSYRGRHYIKDKQGELGKADFSRALLLPDGEAVTVNNLAEAGYTRSDLFQPDYDAIQDSMSSASRCLAAASKLGQKDKAAKFSQSVSSKKLDAIKLCQLTTGREEAACDEIVSNRISSIISLSNRLYKDASQSELNEDLKACNIQ